MIDSHSRADHIHLAIPAEPASNPREAECIDLSAGGPGSSKDHRRTLSFELSMGINCLGIIVLTGREKRCDLEP
jgi:hypothetical protein